MPVAFSFLLFLTTTFAAEPPKPSPNVDKLSVRIEGEIGPEQAAVAGKLT